MAGGIALHGKTLSQVAGGKNVAQVIGVKKIRLIL